MEGGCGVHVVVAGLNMVLGREKKARGALVELERFDRWSTAAWQRGMSANGDQKVNACESAFYVMNEVFSPHLSGDPKRWLKTLVMNAFPSA